MRTDDEAWDGQQARFGPYVAVTNPARTSAPGEAVALIVNNAAAAATSANSAGAPGRAMPSCSQRKAAP